MRCALRAQRHDINPYGICDIRLCVRDIADAICPSGVNGFISYRGLQNGGYIAFVTANISQ